MTGGPVRDVLSPEGLAALARLASGRLLVALDFDGTLAPIVRDRSGAAMRPRTRELLARVAALHACAVVSGRSRADLERLLHGIPSLRLVGNHGAENGLPAELQADVLQDVRLFRERLAELLGPLPGVEVEDKGLSLALHYRAAPDPARARRLLLAAARSLPGARVGGGKRVVNVFSSRAPDKGDALAALVRETGAEGVLFAGDDETDEDVFARDPGVPAVMVRVGRRRGTRAAWFLAEQAAMDRLLSTLVERGPAAPGRT